MDNSEAKQKSISVQAILKRFPNDIVNVGDILNNNVYSAIWNRAGLELASSSKNFSCFSNIRSIIFWGSDETFYLNSLNSKTKVYQSIERVFSLNPPLIILCNGFNFTSAVKKIANNWKTTVVSSNMTSHELYFYLSGWISETLATYKTIHGTVIYISGIGVLIQGEPGIGKSEVALQLIKKGGVFVADDAVDVTNIGMRLLAKPNDIARTFMEIRGIGIINIARMFGILRIRKQCRIDLVVQLNKVQSLNQKYFERVGQKASYVNIENVDIPIYNVPVTFGRDASDLIEAVVGDFKLKLEGYNSANEFIMHIKHIQKNNK